MRFIEKTLLEVIKRRRSSFYTGLLAHEIFKAAEKDFAKNVMAKRPMARALRRLVTLGYVEEIEIGTAERPLSVYKLTSLIHI